MAVLSRLAILVAMALSCALLPNHNPGDDVLRFDLRLNSDCFCGKGTVCDDHNIFNNPESSVLLLEPKAQPLCASTKLYNRPLHHHHQPTKRAIDVFYYFMLNPLTRWDAARFLTLAIDSRQRLPLTTSTGSCESTTDQACPDPFVTSEQAHAFFPLVPWLYRTGTLWMLRFHHFFVKKHFYLPPTFEGVVVLSALLWNWSCFVIAAMALHDVTYTLTRRHAHLLWTDHQTSSSSSSGDESRGTPTLATSQAHQAWILRRCEVLSYRTALLFCFNPASVFFITAYTECTFAMLTWTGFALWERRGLGSGMLFLRGLAVVLWMLASSTRSNGIMLAAWLCCMGLGRMLLALPSSQQVGKLLQEGLSYGGAAVLVVLPFLWHDWRGYNFHCQATFDVMPTWCLSEKSSTRFLSFSLYSYVQRKHWNVGFLRYYEWKQLPNFILAAPALAFGLMAAVHWIQYSWQRHNVTLRHDHVAMSLWQWSRLALRESSMDESTPFLAPKLQIPDTFDPKNIALLDTWLLSGQFMLGYYAILAITCLLGATVAHVQISTRLIFSSCPAIYWYLTLLGTKHHDKYISWQRLIGLYCFGYIVLGIILHVNWLPWT